MNYSGYILLAEKTVHDICAYFYKHARYQKYILMKYCLKSTYNFFRFSPFHIPTTNMFLLYVFFILFVSLFRKKSRVDSSASLITNEYVCWCYSVFKEYKLLIYDMLFDIYI